MIFKYTFGNNIKNFLGYGESIPHENVSGMDVRLKTNHMSCHFDKIRFVADNMCSGGWFILKYAFDSNINFLAMGKVCPMRMFQ